MSPAVASYQTKTAARITADRDRKSTRLNSSHDQISYAVFCLKKKKTAYNEYLLTVIFHLIIPYISAMKTGNTSTNQRDCGDILEHSIPSQPHQRSMPRCLMH